MTPRRITKSSSGTTFARRPDEAWEPYSEAACENGQIELCLEATQVALSAVESETSAVRDQLADAKARVACNNCFQEKNPSSMALSSD